MPPGWSAPHPAVAAGPVGDPGRVTRSTSRLSATGARLAARPSHGLVVLTLMTATALAGCGGGSAAPTPGSSATPAPSPSSASKQSPADGATTRSAPPATAQSSPPATMGGSSAPAPTPGSAPAGPSTAPVSGSATIVPAPPVVEGSPLQRWLSAPLVEIAHHGGSASWPPASPLAYRNAVAWSPELALEFSARRTADGVWVGSEDATTGAVYGTDLTIATSTWDQLSALRSLDGGQPMSRLDTDLLDVAPADRVLFVDDKDDAHVDELLDLLDQHGGPGRTVIKSYWKTVTTPTEAHRRGYQTWGYYYADEMDQFAATQARFDLLGINASAPVPTYQQMLATGKRVIAHIIRSPAQAEQARSRGATGLMVADVEQVVPQT